MWQKIWSNMKRNERRYYLNHEVKWLLNEYRDFNDPEKARKAIRLIEEDLAHG